MKKFCSKKFVGRLAITLLFTITLLAVTFLVTNPIFIFLKMPNNIFIEKDRLYSDVKFLTDINPPRNYLNLDSLNKAAEYIYAEFEKAGCQELSIQKFEVNKNEYKNIICSYGTGNSERLIIGAHYDVFDNTQGADDNASGVAGILELARVVGREKPALKHRIDLVAYALEEVPFFRTDSMGSAKHAQYLKENNFKVMGVIILEMIGFFSNKKGSQKYPIPLLKLFYPDTGNFIAIVGKFGQQKIVKKVKRNIVKNSNIETHSINAPTFIPGMDFSDHLNYWNKGYEAVMITDTAFYRNPNYHLESDTIEKLNFDNMSEVIKGIYFSAINF